MRRQWKGALAAAACLALIGCSSPNESKTEAPATAKTGPPPELYKLNLDTSQGTIVIEVHRDWAPIGSDHLYELVKAGFYDGDRFFRVVRKFVVQFGINGDPSVNRQWSNLPLPDDHVKQKNAKGTLTYATRGPGTRTTQLFINLRDNSAALDRQGFAPLGTVVSGMDVVERIYPYYGELAPAGAGPDPQMIQVQGNQYLENHFPRLDYIKKATIQ